MVQWKGEIEDAGPKADNLDSVEHFQVPNFFVIESEELENIFGDASSADEIRRMKISKDQEEKIKEAYREIGISSEVRNSNGRARNLVGGQRESQRVSIRVSNNGMYKYRLNVGSSDLIEGLKDVASSYYEKENAYPDLLVQKMVEPDHSGAAMIQGDVGLVEAVDGLGTSLEEGENRPYIYVKHREVENLVPEQHYEVSRNPMKGERRRKRKNPEAPFSSEMVEDLLEKLEKEGLNVKFAFKRGNFYIVDAWEEVPNFEVLKDEEIQGLKVSPGEINGEVGREIAYSEETLPPQSYDKAIVSASGGYTSRDAERARRAEKPAVFSFSHRLEEGQKINMEKDEKIENETKSRERIGRETPAGRVLPLESSGKGVRIKSPHSLSVVEYRNRRRKVSPESYIDSYEKVFSFEGEKLILDTRYLGNLEELIDYLEADFKVLVAEKPGTEVLKKAVKEGFDVYAAPDQYLDRLERKLARAEKQFMLESLRERN